MIQYMSAKEAAEKWNISHRRVSILCAENRIPDVAMLGNMWLIPRDAEKPLDARFKNKTLKAAHPFVKWAGGKGQLLEVLKSNLPKNMAAVKKYAEPMVGGGALLFALLAEYNFDEVYIGDNNSELINAYTAIKNNVTELVAELKNLQNIFLSMDGNGKKTYYYSIRNKFNSTELSGDTSVEKAAYFIFLNKTCFNGLYRVNRKGQFNVPMGAYKNPTICDEENLFNISNILKNVTVVCGDYSLCREFIDKNTFVYLDPPYRPISETSAFTSYNADVFDDSEQIRLSKFIDEINKKGAKIVLSNSDPKNADINDTFFDDLYNHYNIKRVSACRMINSNAEKRGKINELIIHN